MDKLDASAWNNKFGSSKMTMIHTCSHYQTIENSTENCSSSDTDRVMFRQVLCK